MKGRLPDTGNAEKLMCTWKQVTYARTFFFLEAVGLAIAAGWLYTFGCCAGEAHFHEEEHVFLGDDKMLASISLLPAN
jgi:hypothetical protein